MSATMWHPDNPKIIVANGNWATASFPGQSSFRLGQQEEPWFVMKADTGVQLGKYFPTHAEAITFAQQEATKSLPTFATQHLRDCLCVYEPAEGHPGIMRKVFFDPRCDHDHPPFIRDEHPMEVPC